MVRILFKDKFGNKLVEDQRSGGIGLKNKEGKYCIKEDLREFIKENKLGNKIRVREKGDIWVHDNFLK